VKILLMACVLVVCCTPTAPITPSADAAPDASLARAEAGEAGLPCAEACAALAAVSCPLGASAGCQAFLKSEVGSMSNPAVGNRPLTCTEIAQVRSLADARRLGFACP
jgi:hypothetical protein